MTSNVKVNVPSMIYKDVLKWSQYAVTNFNTILLYFIQQWVPCWIYCNKNGIHSYFPNWIFYPLQKY